MSDRPLRHSEGPRPRSVVAVALLTLASRITGVLRVATVAHFLGTGRAADAFQVAFLLPNLLRRLVGEGAVASAVVPVFVRSVQRDDPTARRVFAEKFLSLWLGLALGITLAGIALAGVILHFGFRWGSFAELEKLQLTSELTRMLFWYLFMVGIAAALQGILNAYKVFALPSAAPLVFNVAFVLFAWIAAPRVLESRHVYVLASAVLVGGILQVALMVVPVWRLGVRPVIRWPFDHGGVRQVLRLLLPATLGAGVYQINVLVNTALAGRLEEGSVSALTYSNRLMEVVLGVFVFALSTVSLTSLSHQAAARDHDAFERTLYYVLRSGLFITVPSAVGLYLLREPILSLLLEGGEFGAASREATARAFQFHVLGLCFVGVSRGLVSAFHALKDVRAPVMVAAVNLVVNLVLAWLLSRGRLGFSGIALASSLAALFQAIALGWVLHRRMPSVRPERLIGPAALAVVAAIPMAVVVWLSMPFLEPSSTKLLLGLRLAVVIPLGAFVYFLFAWLLRMPEVRWLIARMTR